MKRVLFVTTEYPPYKGGVGRFLAQLQSQINPSDAFVIAHPIQDISYPKNVVTVSFSSRWIWPRWIPGLLKTLYIAKKEKIDHIVVSSILPLGTCAYLIRYFLRIPYTLVIHGMDILHVSHIQRKRLLIKKILRQSKSIISNSTATDKLLNTYDVPAYKRSVVHPLPFITPETTEVKEPKEEITKIFLNTKVLISVGRLVKRKNFSTIINVANRFRNDQAIQWALIGNGPEYESLKTQIKQLKLESSVHILTGVSNQELAWMLHRSTAMLFLPISDTGDFEGFGLAALEGTFFSLPVLASNQGGVPDAVMGGKSGFMLNPENADAIEQKIKELIRDEHHRQEIANSFLSKAKKYFTKETQQKKLYEALGIVQKQNISVIIPAYNAQNTIESCLKSLSRQKLKPKEIIVVDDGSTDKTPEILKNRQDITFIRQKQSGAPVARNTGAKKATGDFLLFLDSDITASPTMTEEMYMALQLHPEKGFAYSQFYFGWKKFTSFPFSKKRLEKMNYIHTSSLLRKEIFPGFDESLKRHQDWDLWLTITKNGQEGILIPKVLYTIHTEKVRISSWIPSFVYTLPFANKIRQVARYEESASIIRKKHHLS